MTPISDTDRIVKTADNTIIINTQQEINKKAHRQQSAQCEQNQGAYSVHDEAEVERAKRFRFLGISIK